MDLIHNCMLLSSFEKSSRLKYRLIEMTVAVFFEFRQVMKNSLLKYARRSAIFEVKLAEFLTAMN